jgi:hypothetical protein
MTHRQWMLSRTRAAAAYLWPFLAVVAMVLVSYFFFGNRSSAQARQRKSAGNAKSAWPRFQNARAESGFGEDGPDLVRQRMEWFYKQRAFPLGHIPAGARMKAFEHMQRMMENEGKLVRQPNGGFAAVAFALPPVAGSPMWNPIGPAPTIGGFFSPVSGRVTTIAVDPTDPTGGTILVGGAQGGIWRSTLFGGTWTPETDSATIPSLAMGSIAFAPSNPSIVYAGTGEQASTGFDVYYGAGILKSTDGGVTWAPTCPSGAVGCNNPFAGPFSNGFFPGGGARISYITVNPTNPSLVLAGVQIFTGTDSGVGVPGVFCSNDAGLNWANILPGAMSTFVGFASPTVAYVALGRPFPDNPNVTTSDPENGIYKSSTADGGMNKLCSAITFTRLTGTGNNILPAQTSMGRIDLGIAPSDPNTVYASIANVANGSNTNQGIWKTTDGGANWTKTTATDICQQQCWFDNVVKVDLNNSGIIYFGGSAAASGNNPQWVQRSADGGNTWNTVVPNTLGPGLPHVDQHAIAFFKATMGPNTGKVIAYLGNDGGVWRTDDAEAANVTWTNMNGPGLQLTQFYPSLSIHPSNPNIAFAGSQDNASQNLGDPSSLASPPPFNWVDNDTCGDGGWTVIDPVTPSNVYVACIFAQINKSVNNGAPNSFTPAASGIATSDPVNFIAPLTIDPANPNRLYFGTTRVWQTVTNAGSWSAISNSISSTGGVITALGVGGSTGSVVYAGTDDGKVSVATNVAPGLGTFTDVSGGLPGRAVTQLVTDPSDPSGSTAYVTISGFSGFTDTAGHIFKTINGGAAWIDVSCHVANCGTPAATDLPNIPVNDLVVDPGDPTHQSLYVATDLGVFTTADGGATWTSFNNSSLPNVAVFSLRLHAPSRTLMAATHGRGAWKVVLNTFTPTFNISDISPVTVAAGSLMFPLIVHGNGFTANSNILFKLNATTTTITPSFSGATILSATVPAAAIQTGGDAQVTVTDPGQLNPTNAVTFVVTGGGDFSLAFTGPTSMTVSAGQTATYPLTIAALNGFAGTVSLSCSLPATATTCSTSPTSVTQAGNFTVTVTTTSRAFLPYLRLPPIRRFWPLAVPIVLLAFLVLTILLSAKRTRRQRVFAGGMFAVVALFLMFEAVGCGGGSPPPPHGTPAGTYTITATGMSGSTTHTATLTLVVN